MYMYVLNQVFSCCTVTLTITADNEVYVYHNGAVVLSSVDWPVTSAVSLEDACVLAVKAVDTGHSFGILASTSTGVKSDNTWKCSTEEQPGWHLASFDDSAWNYADIIAEQGDDPWGTLRAIDGRAKWIWTSDFTSDGTVYCRKTLCG